jgi:hypothetical protein
MVFHDAIDLDNLQQLDGTKVTSEEGGVDFCMNNPLHGDTMGLNNAHNRNLPLGMVGGIGRMKIFEDISLPDIEVLGAIVALEEKGLGPQIPFGFGRLKGPCKEIANCEPNTKPDNERNPDEEGAMRWCTENKFIDQAVDATSFDSNHHRTIFGHWNFSAEEQVALMGAHSFGKLAVCAGGFNGIEHGPFCNNGDQLIPPLSESSSTFKCDSNICQPTWVKQNGKSDVGFGDGAFFDQTPEVFDNHYFQILKESSEIGFENIVHWCCGRYRNGGCDRKRDMVNELDMRKMETPCDQEWCRSDRGGRTHFKNLKRYAEPADKEFVRDANRHGYVKRVVFLGADMALINRSDTLEKVTIFAQNNTEFFYSFRKAFTKVINMVPNHHPAFHSCSDTQCIYENEIFSCGGIEFKTKQGSQCEPLGPNDESQCFLIGGLGKRGVIRCGESGEPKLCCEEDGGCDFELEAFERELQLGHAIITDDQVEYEL